jgi:hypothetical protein
VAIESVAAAVTFCVMSVLRFGLHLGPLSDQPIRFSAYVEVACRIVMTIAATAIAVGASWSWPGALGAHAFGILAVMGGIIATRRGPTELNFRLSPGDTGLAGGYASFRF